MLGNLLKSLLAQPLRSRRVKRAQSLLETGLSQQQSGDRENARHSFEQSLALDPDNGNAHFWLGILLAGDKQSYAAAIQHLERALTLDPDIEGGWINLGSVYYFQRDFIKAGASFRAALDAAPDSVLAHAYLGIALKETGSYDEALVHLRRAYELAPEGEGTLRNLVVTLIESDRCDEALSVAAGAVERNPSRYEAHLFHGLAHQKLHDPLRALACYDTAAALRPDDAELHDNRGTTFLELGRLPEAIECYERALALRPDYSLPAFHRALTRLLLGDYQRGWDDYELRRLDQDYPPRPGAFPRWDGAPLAGRAILVYSEQGLGDEIMFASILPEVIAAAGHCFIECEPRLEGIFRRSFPAATVYAAAPDRGLPGEIAAREIDVEIAAGSLPCFLRRSLNAFPRHDGYLKADPQRVAYWRARLAQLGPGLKVGISWTGGVRKTRRALRSIPLEQWLPILQTPGAGFVSLQYTADAGAAVAAFQEQQGVRIEHWAEAVDDYDETAALVCALDLVVSVCTAVIHLGGALGRPVWVMAPRGPEWRYGFAGDTMPWYPSVKVFRQPAFGEWHPVISSVAAELRRLAGASGS
ncbi:MAG: tetratricopeptide repeat protein [Betaproteobacteria bacterium]|nr:tetratricopeptide repeat protein [Betaproteobacteria bacterium]